MKTTLLLPLLLICNLSIGLQISNDSKLTSSFVLKDSTEKNHSFNFELLSTSVGYTLSVYAYKDSSTHSIVFHEMSLDVFKTNFISLTKELISNVKDKELEQKSIDTFYKIKNKLDFLDDEPVTAKFILKEDSIHSYLSSNSSIHYSGYLSKLESNHGIKDLEIEIEYGALKNITLRTSSAKNKNSVRNFLIFKNLYPFTASSKFDPEDLQKLRLYCQNCGGNEGIIRFVRIGDLLQIDNILQNYKEDYSPYNQTLILAPTVPIQEVKKELRSKIIDVAVFTDFTGFDSKSPNGLVQIEATRRINLFTKHIQLGSRRDISNYFDYGKILGDASFIDKPSRNVVIIKLNFKQTSYDSLQRNIKNTRDDQLKVLRKNIALTKKEVNEQFLNYATTPVDSVFLRKNLEYQMNDGRKKIELFGTILSNYVKDSIEATKTEPLKTTHLFIDNKKRFIQDISDRYKGDTTATFGRAGYYKMKLKPMRIRYINFIGYFEPTFRYSKIEDNKKILTLPESSYINNSIAVNVIQLYQFQKISLAGELNLLKMSFPQTKVNYYINSTLQWYQTAIKSSFTGDSDYIDVNAYSYGLNGFVKFNPDGRWGCSIGMEYSKSFLLTHPVYFPQNNELLHYKFDAFLNTNRENKLFFRFRLHTRIGDMKDSFSQIQFGYSMNIFQTNSRSAN